MLGDDAGVVARLTFALEVRVDELTPRALSVLFSIVVGLRMSQVLFGLGQPLPPRATCIGIDGLYLLCNARCPDLDLLQAGSRAIRSDRKMTKIYSRREFQDDIDGAASAALLGPVLIATNSKPEYVLLSIDDYRALSSTCRIIAGLVTMSRVSRIAVEIPTR